MWAIALPFLLKNWRAVAVAAAIAFAAGWAIHERNALIKEGEHRALQKMKDANDEAERRAAKGSDAVDACMRMGGDWDRNVGLCRAPKPGG